MYKALRYFKRVFTFLCAKRKQKLWKKNKNFVTGITTRTEVDIVINGSNNTIDIGENAILKKCTVRIFGDNNKLYIEKNTYADGVVFYLEDVHNEIRIGEKSAFFGSTHLAATEGKSIRIGGDCLFADNITIRSGDSHAIFDHLGERINHAEDVEVGPHVWVCAGATLLKGSQVGGQSIVAAQALVLGRFPDANVILAGNPAQIVRRDIYWTHARS